MRLRIVVRWGISESLSSLRRRRNILRSCGDSTTLRDYILIKNIVYKKVHYVPDHHQQ